jgi:hypothetical protein|tara:strand:- start:606 stop:788 length:183 start_codon:yes stop_codon:yes gene_type:complete
MKLMDSIDNSMGPANVHKDVIVFEYDKQYTFPSAIQAIFLKSLMQSVIFANPPSKCSAIA